MRKGAFWRNKGAGTPAYHLLHKMHTPSINKPGLLFDTEKEALLEVIKMRMIVDGKYLESDENDTCEYWDIEDRLYEQYKEMKIEGD